MENKPNRGAIFKNEKTKDTQPDYRGVINVDGKDKSISLWLTKSKDGTKTYFSAQIQEPYKKDGATSNVSMPADDAGDLPF